MVINVSPWLNFHNASHETLVHLRKERFHNYPGRPRCRLGGTQGIMEGIACPFAQAGAEVWIVGRNEAQGAPPNGTYIRTSEGIEQHVSAQVLSRFMLGMLLVRLYRYEHVYRCGCRSATCL
ncbi:hypothetical protein JB92DRAFT_3003887, partial [Gautieria morchelliformis]